MGPKSGECVGQEIGIEASPGLVAVNQTLGG